MSYTHPLLLSLSGRSDEIEAVVEPEVPVGDGYIDIAVALRGAVIGVEAKIWSKESRKQQGKDSMGQTTYYRHMLENPR